MSTNEENTESQGTSGDFSETFSDEYIEYKPTKPQNIIVEQNDDIGTEISQTVTVILKAITHRGTQTLIQCDPDENKKTFLDMLVNTKI